MPTSVLHLIARGKVQGVYYRASAQTEAQRLQLDGWARNLRNGDVEMLIVGPQPALDAFCDWARRGPTQAHVSELIVSQHAGENEPPRGFEIRPTV